MLFIAAGGAAGPIIKYLFLFHQAQFMESTHFDNHVSVTADDAINPKTKV